MTNRLRPTRAAATTTTMVVLVAMVASVSAVPVPTAAAHVRQAGLVDPQQLVAAAVAAAARELDAGTEDETQSVVIREMVGDANDAQPVCASLDAWPTAPVQPLPERLLDLPPPVC